MEGKVGCHRVGRWKSEGAPLLYIQLTARTQRASVCIYSDDMVFDWDDEKNAANLAKHDVSFELASYVFDDPLHHSVLDPCEHEERWRTIGVAKSLMTILVVHTITEIEGEEELIRIISARLATAHERRAYEESQQEF